MASSFRLQPLTEVDADTTQPLELVADVTGYSTLVVQVRKPALSGGGTLSFQTSAVLEDSSFLNIGSSVSLSSGTNEMLVLENPLRYLRWTVDGHSGGTARFLVDVVGRE